MSTKNVFENEVSKDEKNKDITALDPKKYRNFKQLVNLFYNEEIENIDKKIKIGIQDNNKVKIEPIIIYDKLTGSMKVEFKIGIDKMYKINELSEFYTRMLNGTNFKYGTKLEFTHIKENFQDESIKLLEYIMKYAEIIKYVNSNSNSNYRYYGNALNDNAIIIDNSGLDEIFDILLGKEVKFEKNNKQVNIAVKYGNPNIEFCLKKKNEQEYEIAPNVDIYTMTILKGKNYVYILTDTDMYRCDEDYEKTTLKLIESFKQNYLTEVPLGKAQLGELFSIIMPKVKETIKIDKKIETEINKYKPKKLVVKIYLDFDSNNYIVADTKFCYENEEFNPLNEKIKINLPRNIIEETKALNMFRKTGFMLDVKNLRFILPNDEKMYEFLTNDIEYYMKNYEVLVTDNFKTKQIREPKISGIGVKVENDLLSIDLTKLNVYLSELEDIMEKYSLKKKFHRLKNGEFINLEENETIEFLDKLVTGMDVSFKQLEKGTIKLPVHRTLYMNQLLKNIPNTEIVKNSEYREIVDGLSKDRIEENAEVPECLEKTLRFYQKTGFKWLKVLDNYKFGGILADDMGLGKTIQMLSLVYAYIEDTKKKERRASIVVSPSSLALNWQNESKKFTTELKTLVIRGNAQEREKQLEKINQYDLIITTYDLLKRDIEVYKKLDYQFRYIIADEAQYLKNSTTQNAKCIKDLKADTRYALTGTPIENSLAELWSIFDYIMPGYLFTYKKFKTIYETPIVRDSDKKALKKLKMLIEPFVLRRTKKEVLTELPEKTITVLNNQMKEEQEKIYMNYLARAKADVANALDLDAHPRSQMQILAALTRLRQICCHPSLFVDGYDEGSSKLEQCMEIVRDATEGGHKILLFSGYTSMLKLIEEELKKTDIKYFKLTGSTKVEERIELVDEFNENENIKVFLISLKAGGTGLNLTGADMVIHYDPWWNASAENQATDRAYRIGQKNNVQVYKLITKNSIEEKIYNLQQKKTELIDNMLDTKTSFLNKLSKEEIMKLFE